MVFSLGSKFCVDLVNVGRLQSLIVVNAPSLTVALEENVISLMIKENITVDAIPRLKHLARNEIIFLNDLLIRIFSRIAAPHAHTLE